MDQRFVLTGERRLEGRVSIGGSKNSAVASLPAALLASDASTLDNVPGIEDVLTFANILRELGAEIDFREDSSVRIAPNGFATWQAPYGLVKRLRASYYLLGVLLAKFGKAEVALPGGCDIGLRPIDQHLKGFKAMGAQVVLEHGIVKAYAPSLKGASIYLDVVSVGATVNIMLAATLAQGTTTIENAAKEPHIVDLANYLNAMGARVQGAGTDIIRVKGVKELRGTVHSIIPDDIEAGTFLLAGVATRGDVTVENVIPKHLESISAKLSEMGAILEDHGDAIRVVAKKRPKAVNAKTLPYPGFPTDLQQPMVAVMSKASGVSVIQETMYDNRFGYANELIRMGASVKVDGRTAIVEGVETLYGAPVTANDLRGGAALIVASLSAEGETEIFGLDHIDRGYEGIETKLSALGADIKRLKD